MIKTSDVMGILTVVGSLLTVFGAIGLMSDQHPAIFLITMIGACVTFLVNCLGVVNLSEYEEAEEERKSQDKE